MTTTSTQKLADAPDDRLREFVKFTRRQATQTQSEAYTMLTAAQHEDIDPLDVLEIRCAPDPALEVAEGVELPEAREQWHGWLLKQGTRLYRCHGQPVQTLTGNPSDSTRTQVNGVINQALVRSADEEPGEWRVVEYAWVAVQPSYADRTLSGGDSQLRVFKGAADNNLAVRVHPDMAAGLEGRPREN